MQNAGNIVFVLPCIYTRPGDQWCLCAARWQEALEAGAAPMVVLRAIHAAALRVVKLADLKQYAVDLV